MYSGSGVIETVEVTDLTNGARDTIITGDGDKVIAGGAGGDVIDLGAGDNEILGDGGTLRYTGGVLTQAFSTGEVPSSSMLTSISSLRHPAPAPLNPGRSISVTVVPVST